MFGAREVKKRRKTPNVGLIVVGIFSHGKGLRPIKLVYVSGWKPAKPLLPRILLII